MIRLNGLTGGLLGSAVVALGFAGSVVLVPPTPQTTVDTPIAAPVKRPAGSPCTSGNADKERQRKQPRSKYGTGRERITRAGAIA